MHSSPRTSAQYAIDALITWVDGTDFEHRNLRNYYIEQSPNPLSENGTNPHRWEDDNEIHYCLRSIGHYAPWVRKIWIVTNGQRPDLTGIGSNLRSKIEFVDHNDIFQGQTQCLPTFNSVSIETVMWKIPDLAEQFLYFNDDVFLTNPVTPDDFFVNAKPRLRGRWDDFTPLSMSKAQQNAPENFNLVMHLNSSVILDLPIRKVFKSAHVVHPFLKSHLQKLEQNYPSEFASNTTYRFRDTSQFSPQALHNQSLLNCGQATINPATDYMHVYSGIDTAGLLALGIMDPDFGEQNIKMLCINDLPKVTQIYPEIVDVLETLIPASE